MAGNPACLTTFVPMLSPYIDGELSPSERVTVERHLSACRDCTARAADLRAESGLIRLGMEMLTDEADFKDFAQKVMARVTPERPPLFERMRLSLSETFMYQRGILMSSMATAAVIMLIAVPLILRDGTPVGYAADRMTVETVKTEAPHVAPVVMETEGGDAVIWLVDERPAAEKDGEESDELGVEKKKPEGGDL